MYRKFKMTQVWTNLLQEFKHEVKAHTHPPIDAWHLVW